MQRHAHESFDGTHPFGGLGKESLTSNAATNEPSGRKLYERLLGRWDLVAGFTYSLVCLVYFAFVGSGFLLALPLATFIPGYAVVSLIFPDPASIASPRGTEANDTTEGTMLFAHLTRLTLAVALSIGLVGIVAYILNSTSFGITAESMGISLSVTSLALFGASALREYEKPASSPQSMATDRSQPVPAIRHMFRGATSREMVTFGVLAVILVVLTVVSFQVATSPTPSVGYTEFFVLSQNGTAIPGPVTVAVGNTVNITAVAVNKASQNQDYIFSVSASVLNVATNQTETNTTVPVAGSSFQLAGQQRWNATVSYAPQSKNTWVLVFSLKELMGATQAYDLRVIVIAG